MPNERLCPKCGKSITRIQQSDLATVDELGIKSDAGAICFCCPFCQVILGVAPNLDWIADELSNIPAAVDQLRQVHNRTQNKPAEE
jgi:hypothetical protein